jgi:LmbE family N-acetylglucosaminyl deacetylase
MAEKYPGCTVHWEVFSAARMRAQEGRCEASLFAGVPFEGALVKKVFEELKYIHSPDLVFTHKRNDAHQDHHLIAELTWNTFRVL